MMPPHSEPDDPAFQLPQPSGASLAKVGAIAVLVVGGALAYGMLRHNAAEHDFDEHNASAGVTRVEVVSPKPVKSEQTVQLPGVITPVEETPIYAQATGYVKAWFVDIGDKVTAGQLLAEIEVPEIDAQLVQAQAQLAQAQASVRQAMAQQSYTKNNAARYVALSDQQLVAKSTVEQTTSQAQTDEATVAAAQSNAAAQAANLNRVRKSRLFAKVIAPFAGVITRRDIATGVLVSANKEMFDLVAIDPMLVFIDVPQAFAPSVHPGVTAKLTADGFGNRTFDGAVFRSAGALDPGAHTMTTEVRVPNPDGTLMAGMYVRVGLTLSSSQSVVEIPATALYMDAAGLRVAKVDKEKKLHFVPIAIARDTGANLQISSGLTPTDKILRIAIPGLVEGQVVEPVAPPKDKDKDKDKDAKGGKSADAKGSDAKPADAKSGDAKGSDAKATDAKGSAAKEP